MGSALPADRIAPCARKGKVVRSPPTVKRYPGSGRLPAAWGWSTVIEMALEDDSHDDILLVAPKAARKKKLTRLVDGIANLRDLGIAEHD